ncbi:MAG: carbamoyltransferase HypF [Candidatus Omnitrophica bacterium]|nr:carbamoyltransferase HypF [Candidatus Omnitrophota bacterium]
MITLDYPFKKEILACGTRDWSGICLTKKNCGYLVNDFNKSEDETLTQYYERRVKQLETELKVKPKVVVHDLHPDYHTTKYARDFSQKNNKLHCLAIQHHHAHIASCMAENEINEVVMAVVLDNAGYGEDGNYWGGGFFVGDFKGFRRLGHLQYVPLTNGGQSLLESWRLASGFLFQTFGESFVDLPIDFIRRRQASDLQQFKQNHQDTQYCSSAGSLFDAVAAIVGLREKVDYEGQGAIELERIANRSSHVANRTYDFSINKNKEGFLIQLEPIFKNIVEDLKNNISRSIISAAFYNTITEIIKDSCQKIGKKEKINKVVLTGSIFQNKPFCASLQSLLQNSGLEVVTHKQFYINDNSVPFGQAVIANIKK